MAAEVKKEIQLEIAHVLFIDIVGYSKLSINEQHAAVEELNQVVRASEQFQRAEATGRLLKIATGDGMALVFYTSPEAPAHCALEISRALKEHPRLHVRMGVHSGPVSGVVDVNNRPNLAGAGLNMAQRVMNCGDAGHILVSKHVAEDLEEYEHWRPLLHDLGTCEVKHGMRVGIANLYGDQVGNPQLPKKFQALKKRSARMRWAAMTAVLLALAAIVAGLAMFSRYRARSTLAAPEKSIAVLPLENLSGDPNNAYFADGIQEEILTRLAGIADLKVISRSSTQQYQSKPRDLREIAKQLGVANILEGSVQKAADRVRVNVQLVSAQTDSHLWADTFDRQLTDIFGVESEIAKGIAESLQAKLSSNEKHALAVKPTNNPEAYDAYLRGLSFQARSYSTYSGPDLDKKASGFYERAVQLDPKFATAWARLSRVNAYIYFAGLDTTLTPAAWRDTAKRALANAQKLEPDSPETLFALGYYQYWVLCDYGAAKATFNQLSKTLRGSGDVPQALALVARREGHWDQSIAYYEQALKLDPRNVDLLDDAAVTYEMVRQFPAALKLYDRALDIVPNDPDMIKDKAFIYQTQGNLQEAAKLLSGINEETPSDGLYSAKIYQLRLERNYGEAIRLMKARPAHFPFDSDFEKGGHHVGLALIQHLAGDTAGAKLTAEQARNTLEPVYRDQPNNVIVASMLSTAYAVLGEKDLAVRAAESAVMLMPRAKDAWRGPLYETSLAGVLTMVGENTRAISTLRQLLQTPYLAPMTPARLRLDPEWDPLRADPAFQKLCEEKQH
jgi:TolB-like protein/class 3 adenylate cyclase/Tfp pilus assembly protein PilF